MLCQCIAMQCYTIVIFFYRFHVAVFANDGNLLAEFECPHVKVFCFQHHICHCPQIEVFQILRSFTIFLFPGVSLLWPQDHQWRICSHPRQEQPPCPCPQHPLYRLEDHQSQAWLWRTTIRTRLLFRGHFGDLIKTCTLPLGATTSWLGFLRFYRSFCGLCNACAKENCLHQIFETFHFQCSALWLYQMRIASLLCFGACKDYRHLVIIMAFLLNILTLDHLYT